MYTAVVLCAVVAAANAQFFAPWGGAAAGSMAGQAGFADSQFGAQAAGAQRTGAQGLQGSQGSMAQGQGRTHADAQQAAGRYDHAASLLAASERTSAAAEQSAGDFDTGYAYGGAQGSQGSQGSQMAAGQFGQTEGGAQRMGQQAGAAQQAYQPMQQHYGYGLGLDYAPLYGQFAGYGRGLGYGYGLQGYGYGLPLAGGHLGLGQQRLAGAQRLDVAPVQRFGAQRLGAQHLDAGFAAPVQRFGAQRFDAQRLPLGQQQLGYGYHQGLYGLGMPLLGLQGWQWGAQRPLGYGGFFL